MHCFRLLPRVYLERFDSDSLLLIADRDCLLTVNSAAADLYVEAVREFGSNRFSLQEVVDRLSAHYDLNTQQCRVKARELLAFALRHGLAGHAGQEKDFR